MWNREYVDSYMYRIYMRDITLLWALTTPQTIMMIGQLIKGLIWLSFKVKVEMQKLESKYNVDTPYKRSTYLSLSNKTSR